MDFGSKTLIAAGLFSLTLLVNLLFGHLRRKTKRFSFEWFLCIHIPIPFIFVARVLSHLDFRYIPLFVLAAVMGQLWGGKVEF